MQGKKKMGTKTGLAKITRHIIEAFNQKTKNKKPPMSCV